MMFKLFVNVIVMLWKFFMQILEGTIIKNNVCTKNQTFKAIHILFRIRTHKVLIFLIYRSASSNYSTLQFLNHFMNYNGEENW